MRLPDKAESHYKELIGIKVSEIERECQPKLRHAKEFMPRGGARGKAIADAILSRWRMLAEAKMDCWLAAYRKFGIKLEKADALTFAKEKFDGARESILKSFELQAGGAAGNHFTSQFEQINRETRLKLLVAVTDLELERKETKKRKKEEKKMRKRQETTINVGRDAIGSSFQTGKKVRLTSVNVQLSQTLHQVRDEFNNSTEFKKPDKTEALRQIDKLIVAANKEPTPGRLQKMKKRVDAVLGFASTTAQLIRTIGPLIEKVKEHLPDIQW